VASGASLEIVTWGVYDLAKDGSTFNPGDKVYWDNVNLCDFGSPAPASTTPGNREIGVADLVQATCVSAPGGLTGDVQPMNDWHAGEHHSRAACEPGCGARPVRGSRRNQAERISPAAVR